MRISPTIFTILADTKGSEKTKQVMHIISVNVSSRHCGSHLQKLREVRLVGAGRVLPVDVQPIKAVLPEEGDGVVSEQLTLDTAGADGLKARTACSVASHSQQHLQLGVRVLQT